MRGEHRRQGALASYGLPPSGWPSDMRWALSEG